MAGITFTEGSGLNDSIFGKSQAPIRMFLEKRAEAFEQQSMLPKLFKMTKSENWAEKYTAMTSMEGFQPVGEMGKHPHDHMEEGYDKIIRHEVWKDRFSISREAVDDNKIMDLEGRPGAFIAGYYRTRERFGAAMLGGAISGQSKVAFGGKSFDAVGADGQPLFSKAHPSKVNKGTQSNLFADAFSADALMAMESAMQDVRDDSGNVLTVAPTTILIPNDYTLKRDVFAAIGADKDPNTANNGFNFIFGRWNVIIWQYLNQFITKGTKPWVLLDERYNEDYAGAIFQDMWSWRSRATLTAIPTPTSGTATRGSAPASTIGAAMQSAV
ncbi:MAG: hypothetical protein J6C52_01415 [Clostridia bacterium]|nr:hypothetical protein [Clostridia bacterium]